MTKSDIINELSEKINIEKATVEKVLEGFERLVIENLQAGKEVTLTGFGTFLAKFRSARKGVNPQNPSERIDMPATTVPKFKAGKTLKDSLKGRVIGKGTDENREVPETHETHREEDNF